MPVALDLLLDQGLRRCRAQHGLSEAALQHYSFEYAAQGREEAQRKVALSLILLEPDQAAAAAATGRSGSCLGLDPSR